MNYEKYFVHLLGMLKKSKYRNRRSVSYLGWKANNDQLLELTKLLRNNAVALRDFTGHVNGVLSRFDNQINLLPHHGSARESFINSIYTKLSDYAKPQRQFLTTIFEEATDKWSNWVDIKNLQEYVPPPIFSAPQEEPAGGWKTVDLDRYLFNANVTLPPLTPKREPSPEEQRREYLLILKDIAEREKNALDKKLAGNPISVFISAALDLRDRIRIFLRPLRIPTHDGKDEDSVRIVFNKRSYIYYVIFKKLRNGKERQYKSCVRLCYC